MTQDEQWMQIAIEEAKLAFKENEVPVGCVLIQNDKIIAKTHNQPISKNDPTAHAEILALRYAAKKLQNYRLLNTSLYITLEPCLMCLGAIAHARVGKIIFGAYDSKNRVVDSKNMPLVKSQLNLKMQIVGGVLEEDCKKILKSFFISRRNST